ncbi:MAG TPA: restriction endonuclease [Rubrivivax sp.]|nr:restriction endonuclease [Rubrivivax sp.]
MKLKMAPNSLFAILLRSPWWISLGVAAGVGLVARLLLPDKYAVAGMLCSFPFLVIAAMAAWKQARAPSAAQTGATLQRLNSMSSREVAAAIEAAFRSQGHQVQKLNAPGADLALSKDGRRTLVSWRRWKAASTGIEPMRELHAAQQRQEAGASLYIAGGEISDKARSFAKEQGIRLMDVAELAQLLHRTGALPRA